VKGSHRAGRGVLAMKSVKGWRRLGCWGGSGWGGWDGEQEWERWR